MASTAALDDESLARRLQPAMVMANGSARRTKAFAAEGPGLARAISGVCLVAACLGSGGCAGGSGRGRTSDGGFDVRSSGQDVGGAPADVASSQDTSRPDAPPDLIEAPSGPGPFETCPGPGGPACAAPGKCVDPCPSVMPAGGLCTQPANGECVCGGVLDDRCGAPATCLCPCCGDGPGMCATPAERASICAGPAAGKFAACDKCGAGVGGKKCCDIEKKYRSFLGTAKSCSGGAACGSKVPASLLCGCETFVADPTGLDETRAAWDAWGCKPSPATTCPGVTCEAGPCKTPASAGCETSKEGARCVDKP